MPEPTSTRIGTALRRMAEDLVVERRRVLFLTRENRELRKQLEVLQRSLEASERPMADHAAQNGSGAPGRHEIVA